jgi:hypothetical protein
MKLALSLVVLSALVYGQAASAGQKFDKVDLRSHFRGTSLNLYPDGTPYYAGVDILVPAPARGFTTSLEMVGEGTCKVLKVSSVARSSTVRVLTDLEIDDGICHITIRLKDGRKATVSVENVGT